MTALALTSEYDNFGAVRQAIVRSTDKDWNPESMARNPESKTVLDFLTWGESELKPNFYHYKRKDTFRGSYFF